MTKLLTKKRIFLFPIILVAILFVIFAGSFVWHFRPLLKTNDIAAFEINGEQRSPIMVYTRLGFPEEYWLISPTDCFIFLAKEKRICIPIWLGRRPYLHYNHDMALGVALDDEIKNNGEYLSRTDENLIFCNGNRIYEIKL